MYSASQLARAPFVFAEHQFVPSCDASAWNATTIESTKLQRQFLQNDGSVVSQWMLLVPALNKAASEIELLFPGKPGGPP